MIERLKKYWQRRGAASVALAGGALLIRSIQTSGNDQRSYPTEQSIGAG
jgi:hypothetical protein